MGGAICQVAISGRVQGVGYRAWVRHEATTRGLEGWVRNRRDGSVEAVFAGESQVVAEIIVVCRRGPVSARVEAVLEEPGNPDALNLRASGEMFSMLPTV